MDRDARVRGHPGEIAVVVGARLQEIDAVTTATQGLATQYDEELSRLQDLDYASALTDLTKRQFNLEAAEISGVTIPKTVLQELLSYYSRTKDNPNGINMDDPFELPSRIREIRVGKATSTIVQQ